MTSFHSTVIVGNVGRDPEMKYLPSGVPVCSFSVAVNRRWKDQRGEQREKTTWFRVTAWRGLAETVNDHVRKGMLVLVSGDVDASAYLTDDGQPRATLELTAREVLFLSARSGATDSTWVKENRNER